MSDEFEEGIKALREAIEFERSRLDDPTPGKPRMGTPGCIACPVCGKDLRLDWEMYSTDQQEEKECPHCHALTVVECVAVPILLLSALSDDVCAYCGKHREEDWPGAADPCVCLKGKT